MVKRAYIWVRKREKKREKEKVESNNFDSEGKVNIFSFNPISGLILNESSRLECGGQDRKVDIASEWGND